MKQHSEETRASHIQQRDCSMGGSPRRVQSPRPGLELFWASSSVLRMRVILETLPSPPPPRNSERLHSHTQPPGCCHSAAVSTWKSLTSCSTGASCGSSSAAADRPRATLQRAAGIVGETPEPHGDLFWGAGGLHYLQADQRRPRKTSETVNVATS